MDLCVLIMAGGHGTRFWPWSSEVLPKQFLPIAHPERTLLQQTYLRVRELAGGGRILVLTNREYLALVRTQLPDLPAEHVIGEPMLRDTSAAVALGAAVGERLWPGSVQVVLPADHEIGPDDRFREVVRYAAESANRDRRLYTLGIVPSRPSSAYGYLQRGEFLESPPGLTRAEIESFVEKPDEGTARSYIESGAYYWNAGIFIWRPDAIQEALARRLPQHAAVIPNAVELLGSPGFDEALRLAFLGLPKISVDFGVMQAEGEAGNVRTVEGDFRWSDLGGWEAFAQRMEPDSAGNRVFGHALEWTGSEWRERWIPRQPKVKSKDEDLSLGDVALMDARDNLVFNNRQGHRVSLFGTRGLAVIHTHRETLVTTRSLADSIKALVSRIPSARREGGMTRPEKVNKPWGWELWWGWTDDFAGKTLFLKKGKRFSLQYHVTKEEVIYLHQGRARLETAARGEELETIDLEPGQAIHVEPGRLHRIEALEDCLLFESSLPFLWDVVRVEDDFGREGTREAEVGLDRGEDD